MNTLRRWAFRAGILAGLLVMAACTGSKDPPAQPEIDNDKNNTITFTASSIKMSITPRRLPADGASTAIITISVKGTDPDKPLYSGNAIELTTTEGTLSVPSGFGTQFDSRRVFLSIVNNFAQAFLTAPNGRGQARLRAKFLAINATDAVEVPFELPSDVVVNLSISDVTLPSGGGEVVLRASVTNLFNVPLLGVPVKFFATEGRLAERRVLTDSDGIALTTLSVTETSIITVEAGETGIAVDTDIITVGGVGGLPVSQYTVNPANNIKVNETLTFDGSTSFDTDGGAIVLYQWSFGDATPVQTTGSPFTTHVYTSPGTYVTSLIVQDNDGLTDQSFVTLFVTSGSNPRSDFTFAPFLPGPNELIAFDGSQSSDPDGTIVQYRWNWGDGSNDDILTTPKTSHAYTQPDTYEVTLTVTDNDGNTASSTQFVTVTLNNNQPIAEFTFTPRLPKLFEPITFDASGSRDPDGEVVSYTWNWGDGTPDITTPNPVISHTYTDDVGNRFRVVTLVVTDDDGNDSQPFNEQIDFADNNGPQCSFIASPGDPLIGETVFFNASASFDPDGVIVQFFWDFGDGVMEGPNTASTTSHAYLAEGDFTVTLRILDNEGFESVCTRTVNVGQENNPPVFVSQSVIPDTLTAATINAGGEQVVITITVDDPDGDTLNIVGSGTYGGSNSSTLVNLAAIGPPVVAGTTYTFSITLTVRNSDIGSPAVAGDTVTYSFSITDGTDAIDVQGTIGVT